MADQITMAKYWHQYQAAEIKANRARVELEKLKNTMQHSAGSEDLMELQEKIDTAQAEYDALKEQRDDAYSLAMTGQPRQKVAEISQGRVVYTLGITHQQKIRAARKRPSW